MAKITKEWLQQKISDMEAARDEIPFGLDEDDSNTLAAMKMALASLEAEPVGEVSEQRDGLVMDGTVDLGGASTHRIIKGASKMKRLPLGTKFYTAPPAPVSVPDAMEMDDDFDSAFEHGKAVGWNACRAAMLQGAGPVTIKANGGGSEKDEPPKRGWVVTHSGKDYFYREQGDAATHMNAAVESGIGVSLRSFIPEPVTTAYKLPGDFESFISWLTSGDGIPDWLINGDKLDDEKVSFLLKVYRAGSRDANGKKGEGIFVSKSSEMSVSGITIGESQCRNSPVIPDGWVACSERMPELPKHRIDMPVILATIGERYGSEALYCRDGKFRWGVGEEPIDDATHWMPLPAAPHFREIVNSSTDNFRENAETSTKCPCCGRRPLKNKTCSVAGCDGKHVARGLCVKHYAIERKKDPSRRESIRAADKRYRARKAAAPQQEV